VRLVLHPHGMTNGRSFNEPVSPSLQNIHPVHSALFVILGRAQREPGIYSVTLASGTLKVLLSPALRPLLHPHGMGPGSACSRPGRRYAGSNTEQKQLRLQNMRNVRLPLSSFRTAESRSGIYSVTLASGTLTVLPSPALRPLLHPHPMVRGDDEAVENFAEPMPPTLQNIHHGHSSHFVIPEPRSGIRNLFRDLSKKPQTPEKSIHPLATAPILARSCAVGTGSRTGDRKGTARSAMRLSGTLRCPTVCDQLLHGTVVKMAGHRTPKRPERSMVWKHAMRWQQ
jgi:hypothetical protein